VGFADDLLEEIAIIYEHVIVIKQEVVCDNGYFGCKILRDNFDETFRVDFRVGRILVVDINIIKDLFSDVVTQFDLVS